MGLRQAAYDAKEPDPYVNPDPRCTHGKVPYDGIFYCWGYATAVDVGELEYYIKNTCPKCDLWKEVSDESW